MSLYGALFGGVSGLRAQSSKIGAISDNIANANTIGYKKSTAVFQTLVINQGTGGAYQTGGVRGGTRMNVSQQGLLSSTNSATDVAISGGGFFVVRSAADGTAAAGTATPYYTRAGSFSQDDRGNFVNTQGFFLQGWPLDREGRLPGEQGNTTFPISATNFDSLQTVNVESASGIAQATSNISLGANLKASETVFAGSAGVLVPDTNDTANRNLAASQVLVGAEYGMATSNDLRRGDQFTVTTNGVNNATFEYGGFAVSRNVSSAANNSGDGNVDNTAPLLLNGQTAIVYRGTNDFDITIPNHGLLDGEEVTLAGIAASSAGTTPIGQLNTALTVTRIDANTIRVSTAGAHGAVAGTSPAVSDPFTADVRSDVFDGNIFSATSTGADFLTGVTDVSDAARSFTISTSNNTYTFTHTSGTPNAANGEFNTMTTLASAINAVDGLTARIVSGRMVVSAEDSSDQLNFENVDAAGTATQRGLDWVKELDLKDVSTGINRFNSIQSLATLVNATEDISATVTNPLSSASMTIRVDSPLQTIAFTDLGLPLTATGNVTVPASTYAAGAAIPVTIDLGAAPPASWTLGEFVSISGLDTAVFGPFGLPGNMPNGQYEITNIAGNVVTIEVIAPTDLTTTGGAAAATVGNRMSLVGATNQGSILSAFGIGDVDSLAGADYLTTGTVFTHSEDPRYSANGANGANMASGDISAQFSRNIRVYDSQGFGHDVRFSFIKTDVNTWAMEAHVIPETEMTVDGALNLVDGQIATGTIVFNGDGTLQSVSTNPASGTIGIVWTNGASDSSLTLDLGTAGAIGTGAADGMSQFDSGYNVNFANQNGAPVGQLVSVSINNDGQVIASYSNGQIQALYQLPLADFANPDGLIARSGNIFEETSGSGEVNLREAGTNGTGTIVSSALEQSNVDLAEELTDMIVAQRAYQANTRVIRTTDELLESLNQI